MTLNISSAFLDVSDSDVCRAICIPRADSYLTVNLNLRANITWETKLEK